MTDQTNQTTGSPLPETNDVAESKWYDKLLSDELRQDKNITKFKTLDDFAAWQSNASRLIGKKVEAMSADEIGQFIPAEELIRMAESRGIPSDPTQYELPPMLANVSDDLGRKIKEMAVEAKVTPKQLELFIEKNAELNQGMMEAQRGAWMDELVTTYGDKLESEMELAASAAKKFCSPELMKMLDQAGMGHNPEIVKAFAKMAREMMPDSIPRTSIGSDESKSDPESKIKEKLRDPEFYNRWKRGDRNAMAELQGLYSLRG